MDSIIHRLSKGGQKNMYCTKQRQVYFFWDSFPVIWLVICSTTMLYYWGVLSYSFFFSFLIFFLLITFFFFFFLWCLTKHHILLTEGGVCLNEKQYVQDTAAAQLLLVTCTLQDFPSSFFGHQINKCIFLAPYSISRIWLRWWCGFTSFKFRI